MLSITVQCHCCDHHECHVPLTWLVAWLFVDTVVLCALCALGVILVRPCVDPWPATWSLVLFTGFADCLGLTSGSRVFAASCNNRFKNLPQNATARHANLLSILARRNWCKTITKWLLQHPRGGSKLMSHLLGIPVPRQGFWLPDCGLVA